MSPPAVSVLMLTRDGGDVFASALAALHSCRGIEDAEVIVVDSGSRDDTLSHARRYPTVRVHSIPPSEFGHGRTRNLAATMARGETLLFLVQDAVPGDTDFLLRLTGPLVRPEVAAVYGRQLPRPGTDPVECFYLERTYPDRPAVRRGGGGEPDSIGSMFFSNVCSAIRRSVWAAHPFDEQLIMSEDQKFAKQVLAAGHEIVYEPRATVWHSHGYTLRRLFQRNFDSGVSLIGIVGDTPAQMLRYEMSHLRAGLRYLARCGRRRSIPRLLLFEATRVGGFAVGRHSGLLPRRVKRLLSQHKAYWDRG